MNYNSATVAGVAVAAHEMGHAIQDKEGYFFLRLRCGMGKLTIVASNLSWIVIYLGFLMWYTPLIIVGIALFGVTVFFDLITLPVEMNASKRAFEYLKSTGEYSDEELSGVNKVLKAAAFTYIASTLAGAIQLIRLIGILKSDD
jgi:Zn-dependent membrane protease YugP